MRNLARRRRMDPDLIQVDERQVVAYREEYDDATMELQLAGYTIEREEPGADYGTVIITAIRPRGEGFR